MAVSLLTSLANTSNTATYTTASFTPTAGSLLVVTTHGKATIVSATATGSANGLTFTSAIQVLSDASGSRQALLVADQPTPTSPAAMTVSIAFTGDAATGATVTVLEVSGMTKAGAAAVLQTAGADNNLTASNTPTVAFAAAPQATNPVIAQVGNNTQPATLTPPAGFTEQTDTGFATPTTGTEVVSIDSASPQTLTWGNTSTRGAVIAVELDASGASSGTNYAAAGTVAGASSTSGAVTLRAVASSTAAAITSAVGAVALVAFASGAIAATSSMSGAVQQPVSAASGTVAGASTVSGSPTAVLATSGSVAGSSGTSGAVTAALRASSTTAGTSAASGSVTAVLPTSGTVAGTSTAAGSITATLRALGTVAGTSGVTGNAQLPGTTGTAAGTSSTTGSVVANLRAIGTVAATTTTTGSPTARLAASGTDAATSGASGSTAATLYVSGSVAAATATAGAATRPTSQAVILSVSEYIRPVTITERQRAVSVIGQQRDITFSGSTPTVTSSTGYQRPVTIQEAP